MVPGCFSRLSDRYSELVERRIHPLKGFLIELESCDSLPPHPKLSELVRLIGNWMKIKRKSCRDKVQ